MAKPASFAIATLCALILLTPVITYAVAVLKGHVDPFLPNIAATGDLPPESTIFTELVVITTSFALIVIHIRFVYVSAHCAKYGVESLYTNVNVASLVTGYVMCAGLLFLGCFQPSNAFFMHALASALPFSTGSFAYVTMQTVLSYKLRDYTRNARCVHGRIVLNALILMFLSTYLIGLMLTRWRCSTADGMRSPWCRDGSGWRDHIVSAVSEWLLMLMYIGYIATYYSEFRMVMLTTVKIEVIFLPSPSSSSENT